MSGDRSNGDATLNRLLASFAATAQPPDRAIDIAKDAYLDTLGVTLAGAHEDAARIARELAADESPDGPARIVGTAQRAGASYAALVNGTAAHALDFDDVSFISLGHPSAPLVAATLAAGEASGASGRTVLAAYCVGFEIEMAVGRAINPEHYGRGWHCTSTIGTLGAAAAAARVLGLDTGATARALALAASHASGVKGNFGTMTKPLHAGMAARNGVQSALLAARGFTAADAALDGPQGLLVAFGADAAALRSPLADLGRRWELVETRPSVKLYPSCAGTHPTVDALLDLRRREGFGPDDVASIDLGVDELTPTILQYDRPRTGLEGKFSLHYCAAAAVIDGGVDLETFEDAHVMRPAMQAFLPRVTMRVDAGLDPNAQRLSQVTLAVRLCDGRVLRDNVLGARGHPGRPVSASDLTTKFLACARRVLSASESERVLAAVQRMEQIPRVSELTELLTPSR